MAKSPTGILVVVADRGRARMFNIKHDEDTLAELSDLVNPSLRMHAGDLAHERQGRLVSRNGTARAALGESHFYKQQSAKRFARLVADAVTAACGPGLYECVYLLTEPEFLGLLRPHLSSAKLGIPVREIPKNITHRSATTIRGYLPKHLWKRRVIGMSI